AKLVAHGVERMLRDVQAERLLLPAEELVLLELLVRDRRVLDLEHRLLAEEEIFLQLRSRPECLLDCIEHPPPRSPGRIERAAVDERLQRALVHDLRVDALGEIPERAEGAGLPPRIDDLSRR